MKGCKAKESKWTTEIIKSFLNDLGKKRNPSIVLGNREHIAAHKY